MALREAVSVTDPSEFLYQWPLSIWLTILLVIALAVFCGWTYGTQRIQWTGLLPHRSMWLDRSRFILLALVRWCCFLIVLWMLAGLAIQPYQTDLSELMILIDRSESMNCVENSTQETGIAPIGLSDSTRLTEARDWFKNAKTKPLEKLAEKFRIRWFSMGEALENQSQSNRTRSDTREATWPTGIVADQPHSRLGDNLRDAIALGKGRATAAILVVTDGITTDGWTLAQAAAYARQQLIPIYWIGVGQEQLQPDIRVDDLVVDPTVFLGDLVTVQASVTRRDIDDSRFRLVLTDLETGEVLDRRDAVFGAGHNSVVVRSQFSAKHPGTRTIQLEVESRSDDKHPENNIAVRKIEIRDAAIPVLLVQRYPSYEFRFLKHLLERTRQNASPDKPAFRLTTVLEEADPKYADQDVSAERLLPIGQEAFNAFEVIIVGDVSPQLMSRTVQQSLKQFVSFHGGGLLAIAGPKHMPHDFQNSVLASLLPVEIVQSGSRFVEPAPFRWRLTALGESSLPLQLEAELSVTKRIWSMLPLQQWRSNSIRARPIAQVLSTTQDSLGGDEPLLVTQFVGAGRVAFQATDETFQWQSYRGDDLYYQRYWIQMIRWLSRNKSLQSRSNSEIEVDGREFRLGEPVHVTLRLTGAMAAIAADAGARLLLSRNGGAGQSVELLSSTQDAAIFDGVLTDLQPGQFRLVLAQPTDELSNASAPSAEFSVVAPPGELSELRPAFKSMQEAAEIARGKYVSLSDADQMLGMLPRGDRIRLQPLPIKSLWNHPWAIGILIILLTAEWIGRRKLGLP